MPFIMLSDRRMSSGRGQARTPFSFGLLQCRQREIGKKTEKKNHVAYNNILQTFFSTALYCYNT